MLCLDYLQYMILSNHLVLIPLLKEGVNRGSDSSIFILNVVIACGQVRDEHGRVEKSLFSPNLGSYLSRFPRISILDYDEKLVKLVSFDLYCTYGCVSLIFRNFC